MSTCFLHNVYCCYLPAHCSHGLQPLDNGIFNAVKAAYRRHLQQFAYMSDSRPVDKINFIRAYAKAREEGFTERNIRSGWRVTGNWPISRQKALSHPEIQSDQAKSLLISSPLKGPHFGSDDIPKTSRHIKDLGRNKSPHT